MTERLKKCDALLSRERCTIGLIGVWNFRGTNEHGGKTILPEFEHVALEGREVYVVFDSDVMVKREVAYALHRFGAWLTEIRKARVKYVYLPDSEHGKKQGIDDYLVAGHSLESLKLYAESKPRPIPKSAEDDDLSGQKASVIAENLAKKYRDLFAFDLLMKQWTQYGAQQEGVWGSVEEECFSERLCQDLTPLLPQGFSSHLVRDVTNFLRGMLCRNFDSLPPHLLPCRNGVLNVKTMELAAHAPENGLTWALPYNYDPTATCKPVKEWLNEAMGGKSSPVVELAT